MLVPLCTNMESRNQHEHLENTAVKCFHLDLKRSQRSVPLILCEARSNFKSDWTYFKANNIVSPTGYII